MRLISAHLSTSSTSPLLASIESDRAGVKTRPDETHKAQGGCDFDRPRWVIIRPVPAMASPAEYEQTQTRATYSKQRPKQPFSSL
jgi:hypothetical protein